MANSEETFYSLPQAYAKYSNLQQSFSHFADADKNVACFTQATTVIFSTEWEYSS